MAENRTRTINLALQGGGAHGAFTWGVLDRLLEDDRIELEGVSGTSAGAVNAAVMAEGLAENGRKGAREKLEAFWTDISRFAPFSPGQRTFVDWLTGNWNIDRSPAVFLFDMFTRIFSPYESNPGNFDVLRTMLNQRINFDKVRSCHPLKLFISATNVRTGKIRVFQRDDVSVDSLLASACLPTVFQSVVIDGEAYWDGGYMGNPAIWPLIYNCDSRDVVLVQINPLVREGVPRTTTDILNRLNEITFNSSLIAEMRGVAAVQRLIERGELTGTGTQRFKHMLIHMIEDEATMRDMGAASKFNLDIRFLHFLRDTGRRAADRWLTASFDKIGHESSLDIRGIFL